MIEPNSENWTRLAATGAVKRSFPEYLACPNVWTNRRQVKGELG